MALQPVELDAMELLEALAAVLAGEAVLLLRAVFLHVPVERRSLPTLVATDLTPEEKTGDGSF